MDRLHLNDNPIVIKGYNHCLLCESYETHKHNVYACVHKTQMVHTASCLCASAGSNMQAVCALTNFFNNPVCNG
jgi:glucokinase